MYVGNLFDVGDFVLGERCCDWNVENLLLLCILDNFVIIGNGGWFVVNYFYVIGGFMCWVVMWNGK